MNRQSGDQHWTRRCPERVARGPQGGGAKLSAAAIAELCDFFRVYRPKQTVLAHRYDVSRITVWRHLKAAGLIKNDKT